MTYGYPNYKGDDYPDRDLRNKLFRAYKEMITLGLNRGTSGNCSVRCDRPNKILITPSGIPLENMTPASIVQMDLGGEVELGGKPTSEWRLHCDILKERPDAEALVHTHSVAASALACLRQEIPAFHYMVAVIGGDVIRCAPYALFGTQELSEGVLQALKGLKACLIANHGVIALGRDLLEAVQIAQEVENLAEKFLKALSVGKPHILSRAEMDEVIEKFKDYGYKPGNQPS
jgi:L-fuculose-phosphate aldolase